MRQSKLVSICQHAFGSRGVEIAIGLMRVPWLKIIDSSITMTSLVGIVLLTRSLGAFGILIGFGLWNYWRGLTDSERREREKEPTPQDQTVITRGLVEHVKRMPPGAALHCTSKKDEVDFVVIESSDFEHIVGMAGMAIRKEKRDG